MPVVLKHHCGKRGKKEKSKTRERIREKDATGSPFKDENEERRRRGLCMFGRKLGKEREREPRDLVLFFTVKREKREMNTHSNCRVELERPASPCE